MMQETALNTRAVTREISGEAGCYSAQTIDNLYVL